MLLVAGVVTRDCRIESMAFGTLSLTGRRALIAN
jgi:hypothetical protein